MIGREYFVQQARTLLRMARIASDPSLSKTLASKAAEFDARKDEAPIALRPGSERDGDAAEGELAGPPDNKR